MILDLFPDFDMISAILLPPLHKTKVFPDEVSHTQSGYIDHWPMMLIFGVWEIRTIQKHSVVDMNRNKLL